MSELKSPVPGEPLRADWARGVTDRVNNLYASSRPGTLVSEGVGGLSFSPLPENKRNRRGSPVTLPWTFVPGVGWTNCRFQLGYALLDDTAISNLDMVADGDYYLKVHASTGRAELAKTDDFGDVMENDYEREVVYFYIGRVEEGEAVDEPHIVPVIYTFC